jgi:SAM-dependent methyltransferase
MATLATQGERCGTVVDVGGGTASARSLWPEGWTYISVDPDQRVVDFDGSGGTICRLVGDASNLGFRDHSLDVLLMKDVSHHLSDRQWAMALAEIRRTLKPDGYFLFVDGLWSHRRLISRLGWALDAGRFPRPYEVILSALEGSFDVESVERLTLLHDSVIIMCRPRLSSSLERIKWANR